MGKTRAEIQKEYREKKKKNDPTNLEKERKIEYQQHHFPRKN